MAGPTEYGNVVAALQQEFAGDVAPEVVERCVMGEAARVADARIRSFLDVLIHKAARAQLVVIRHQAASIPRT
ncbi:MAG: hypothetical protein M3487_09195 [Actinomycetota bacterium]|nr:hypothetical protein [Actinomycetota bacterium]